MSQTIFTFALVGNPNSGKSTLFNHLTGLRQHVGNFPGVTVEKKKGPAELSDGQKVYIIDLPGTYSLHPTSGDERIVTGILSNPGDPNYPDAIIYVADLNNLEKHLLLFTQILDLQIPVILVLNMLDLAMESGLEVDTNYLSAQFGVPVVAVSSRNGMQIETLDAEMIILSAAQTRIDRKAFFKAEDKISAIVHEVQSSLEVEQHYLAKIYLHHGAWLPFLSMQEKEKIAQIVKDSGFKDLPAQIEETLDRFDRFEPIARKALKVKARSAGKKSFSQKVDQVVTNPIIGPFLFFALMVLVFQAIFDWSSYPMDWIEQFFTHLSELIRTYLPAGWFNDLLTDGLIAGLGGILVFVPQIAILFLLISILEESGYMARAVFLFDRPMKSVGMNGRSLVALISGGACAIPAIMATRTITNWKERLITILVLPFISCSARIPVYTVLIALVIPSKRILGFLNLQGLVFMGLYLLGIVAALLSAWVLKTLLKTKERSYLMIELPAYQMPVWRNVGLNIWSKVWAFVAGAGKIIILFSIVLWFLASYGPSEAMQTATETAQKEASTANLDASASADLLASYKIEASYAGQMGHFIEPAIRPLGFDWKIGIALITSFAAREIFIASIATIYSVGSHADNDITLRQRMALETRADNGQPVFTVASGMSLLIFYVLAMQCMSTLAVVKRETRTWKWPILQFLFMTGLAYLGSWVTWGLLG
ncbi:MAG: ferrous iron transport protein B [Saprospiraceae bacterium]